MKQNNYNPAYYLAALGNGGLSTSFFMYLMFMVPHPNTPMVTFDHIFPYIKGDNTFIAVSIVLALIGIIYFSFRHFQKLIWNIKEFNKFKKTAAYEKLKNSNGASGLMAVPLTYAMSINVMFVLGAVFVPNLWSVIEIMLPFALLGFFAVGVYALRLFIPMMSHFLTGNTFSEEANNNFGQLLTVFAFTMIAVGFAAPGGMSSNLVVSGLGIFFSLLFLIAGLGLLLVHTVMALHSNFKHGFSKEAGPSIWIFLPIFTLIAISGFRISSGVFHNFLETNPAPVLFFIGLGTFVALQIVFGLVGNSVLNKLNYFGEYVAGKKKSAASYGLICPGVAFFVLGMFFVHWGLVETGIIAKFSIGYFVVLVPFILVQLKTIQVLGKLNRKHFKGTKNTDIPAMQQKTVQ